MMTGQTIHAHRTNRILVILTLAWAAYNQVLGAWSGGKEWLLLAASMMRNGSVPYADIMETNPPLILWLYQIPVYLADTVNMEPAQILAILALLLAAASLYLCAALLARNAVLAAMPQVYEKILWLIAFIFVGLPERFFFADREHLFLLLALPYCLSYMPGICAQPVSSRLRVTLALLATIGFCIKPHMLVFPIAIALLRLWRDPGWKTLFVPEHWVIGLGGVFYMILIGSLTPEYFTVMWPLLRETYSSYTNGLMGYYSILPALFGLLLAFAGYRSASTPLRSDLHYLLWLCATATLYALINNGWHYTFYPLNAFMLLVIGWLLAEYGWIRANHDDEKMRIYAGTGITCSKLFVSFYVTAKLLPLLFSGILPPPLTTFEKLLAGFENTIREEKADSFSALSIHFGYWPRLAHTTGSTFASRYHMLWPLYKYIKDDSVSNGNDRMAYIVAQGVADDLSRKKPDLIFVDTSPDFGNTGTEFDVIRYFQRFPAFASAWENYTFLRHIDFCPEAGPQTPALDTDGCRYDVFKRRDNGKIER